MANKKHPNRLFFAIDLEPQLKTQLLTLQQSMMGVSAQAVKADNFHITLSFLGDCSDKQVEAILDGLLEIKHPPFELTFEHLTFWPKPGIFSLVVNDKNNSLTNCKKLIERQLSQLQFFAFDKKEFKPHISLFRQVEMTTETQHIFTQANQKTTNLSLTSRVIEVSLMLSTMSKQGVYYETIAQWPLQNISVKQQLLGSA